MAIMQTNIPAPPSASVAPQPVITTSGPGGTQIIQVPRTRQQVDELRAKRSELSNQLESAASRRKDLSNQLVGRDGADRAGLLSRIDVLDKRIVQLETDIAETGRQLTDAPTQLLSSSGSGPFNNVPNETIPIIGSLLTIFVLAPIALSYARMLWRRANRPVPAAITGESAVRLERLEQSVDTIALEIERISEGQRFVTRLLSEQATRVALPGNGTVAVRTD